MILPYFPRVSPVRSAIPHARCRLIGIRLLRISYILSLVLERSRCKQAYVEYAKTMDRAATVAETKEDRYRRL